MCFCENKIKKRFKREKEETTKIQEMENENNKKPYKVGFNMKLSFILFCR